MLLKDARGKEEFEVSHIPGAIWVDPDASDVTETAKQLFSTKPGMCM